MAGGLAEKLVQFPGGGEEVAPSGPGGGVEQLLLVRRGDLDLLLFQPVLDGFLLCGEEAFFIDLLPPLLPDPFHLGAERGKEAQGGDAVSAVLGGLPQRALDGDLPVAKLVVREGFAAERRRERGHSCPLLGCIRANRSVRAPLIHIEVGLGDLLDVRLGEGAVLFAEVLAQLLIQLRGINELDLALTLLGLVIGQHPDVGGDAGVVEDVVRQLDDGLQVVVLDEVAADIAGTAAGIAGEEGGTIVTCGDAGAERAVLKPLHLGDHLHEEEQLAIIHRRRGGDTFSVSLHIRQSDLKAAVDDDGLAALFFQNLALVGLPALPIRGIGEHEVEAQGAELIRGEGGAVADVFGVVPLDHHV